MDEPVTKQMKGSWNLPKDVENEVEENSKCPDGSSLVCALCHERSPAELSKWKIIPSRMTSTQHSGLSFDHYKLGGELFLSLFLYVQS